MNLAWIIDSNALRLFEDNENTENIFFVYSPIRYDKELIDLVGVYIFISFCHGIKMFKKLVERYNVALL